MVFQVNSISYHWAYNIGIKCYIMYIWCTSIWSAQFFEDAFGVHHNLPDVMHVTTNVCCGIKEEHSAT